ncbi:hypothetical protein AWW66_19770 [Micromonospora rosaria]|uniref:Pecanex-like protein 1 n=1 Tax=Micromonospora rosaria TaxID=47874 RepID=A0A136PPH7_9ACTN|nr:hypothetical protein [Micromonospora rosaria]KXK60291.1 hypothetical protein AWW66_19770 [Micromonospora rosaria]
MRRSTRARRSSGNTRRNRLIAVAGTLAVFGGIVAVTQISSAQDRPSRTRTVSSECVAPPAGATARNGTGITVNEQNGRDVRNHWGDGQMSKAQCQSLRTGAEVRTISCPDPTGKLPREIPARAQREVSRNLALLTTQIEEANRRLAAEGRKGQGFIDSAILAPLAAKRRATLDRIAIAIGRVAERPQGLDELATCQVVNANPNNGNNNGGNNGGNDGGGNNNGLDVLAQNCDNSRLQRHDGFQNGNRCVSTAFGEVGSAGDNPSLLITEFPDQVQANQAFTLRVSTRNLVRDRFLPAGQGGYYLESSVLNGEGLTRGHFHSACRMLGSTTEAPDPAPAPAFFVATEDGAGGRNPDEVAIQVPGLPQQGVAQCAVWAGDGSHRVPMMERANQTPAFDVVRIQVN